METSEIIVRLRELQRKISALGDAVDELFADAALLIEDAAAGALVLPEPWVWPVLDQARVVTSRFNVPRGYGPHEGIDLRAHPGRLIVSVADGRVVAVHRWEKTRKGWDAYGNYVTIEHAPGAGGHTVLYAHLGAIMRGLVAGQDVLQGELIGQAGSTGNTQGAHLHITVTHQDAEPGGVFGQRVVDPEPLLPKPFEIL